MRVPDEEFLYYKANYYYGNKVTIDRKLAVLGSMGPDGFYVEWGGPAGSNLKPVYIDKRIQQLIDSRKTSLQKFTDFLNIFFSPEYDIVYWCTNANNIMIPF